MKMRETEGLKRSTVAGLTFLLTLLLAVWAGVKPAQAQTVNTPASDTADPLTQRIEAVARLISPAPADLEQVFAPSFLAQVPQAQLIAILQSIHAQFGPVQGYTRTDPGSSPHAAQVAFHLNGGTQIPTIIQIEPNPPHRIVGLLFQPPVLGTSSVSEVLQELAGLPGQASVVFARLSDTGIVPLYAHNPDLPLAIGSTFKLYVLAALAEDIRRGERHWSDVVQLREDGRSLPSGILQKWPLGAPITLHTLASLMISMSDNTATDHLMLTLGRDQVESMLTLLGNRHKDRNTPFLTTAEAFRLKLAADGNDENALARVYALATTAEKRQLLDTVVATIPLTALDIGRLEKPALIESVEWFASGTDLVRALHWLRRNADPQILDLLSINTSGLSGTQKWDYVGFKGGSEPGVLNLTFLLRHANGAWYALSAGINNPTEEVESQRFMGAVNRLLEILAKEAEGG